MAGVALAGGGNHVSQSRIRELADCLSPSVTLCRNLTEFSALLDVRLRVLTVPIVGSPPLSERVQCFPDGGKASVLVSLWRMASGIFLVIQK